MGQEAIVRRTEGAMVGGTEFVRQRAWHVGQGAIVRRTEEAMLGGTEFLRQWAWHVGQRGYGMWDRGLSPSDRRGPVSYTHLRAHET